MYPSVQGAWCGLSSDLNFQFFCFYCAVKCCIEKRECVKCLQQIEVLVQVAVVVVSVVIITVIVVNHQRRLCGQSEMCHRQLQKKERGRERDRESK